MERERGFAGKIRQERCQALEGNALGEAQVGAEGAQVWAILRRTQEASLPTLLTAFQTAENLIELTGEAASRIENPVAHSNIDVDLNKEFCMSRETHLAALGQRHDALDEEIAKESVHPAKDEFKLGEMKRRKLQLKDEIAKLQGDRSIPALH